MVKNKAETDGLEEIIEENPVGFTFQQDEMLKTVAKSLFTDKYDYAKALLSAASGSPGVTKIKITAKPGRFSIWNDGQGMPIEKLNHVLSRVFTGDDSGASTEFAIGLLSALETGSNEVIFESALQIQKKNEEKDEEKTQEAVPEAYKISINTKQGELKFSEPERSELKEGTRITVYKNKFSLKKSLVSLIKGSTTPEAVKIKEASKFFTIPVYMNRRRINKPLKLEELALNKYVFNTQGLDISVGFRKENNNSGIYIFNKNIYLESVSLSKWEYDDSDLPREQRTGIEPLIAIVNSKNLKVDLKRTELVKGQMSKILDCVASHYYEMLLDYLKADKESSLGADKEWHTSLLLNAILKLSNPIRLYLSKENHEQFKRDMQDPDYHLANRYVNDELRCKTITELVELLSEEKLFKTMSRKKLSLKEVYELKQKGRLVYFKRRKEGIDFSRNPEKLENIIDLFDDYTYGGGIAQIALTNVLDSAVTVGAFKTKNSAVFEEVKYDYSVMRQYMNNPFAFEFEPFNAVANNALMYWPFKLIEFSGKNLLVKPAKKAYTAFAKWKEKRAAEAAEKRVEKWTRKEEEEQIKKDMLEERLHIRAVPFGKFAKVTFNLEDKISKFTNKFGQKSTLFGEYLSNNASRGWSTTKKVAGYGLRLTGKGLKYGATGVAVLIGGVFGIIGVGTIGIAKGGYVAGREAYKRGKQAGLFVHKYTTKPVINYVDRVYDKVKGKYEINKAKREEKKEQRHMEKYKIKAEKNARKIQEKKRKQQEKNKKKNQLAVEKQRRETEKENEQRLAEERKQYNINEKALEKFIANALFADNELFNNINTQVLFWDKKDILNKLGKETGSLFLYKPFGIIRRTKISDKISDSKAGDFISDLILSSYGTNNEKGKSTEAFYNYLLVNTAHSTLVKAIINYQDTPGFKHSFISYMLNYLRTDKRRDDNKDYKHAIIEYQKAIMPEILNTYLDEVFNEYEGNNKEKFFKEVNTFTQDEKKDFFKKLLNSSNRNNEIDSLLEQNKTDYALLEEVARENIKEARKSTEKSTEKIIN